MFRPSQALRFAQVLTTPGALRSMRRTRPFSSSAFIIARDLRTGCGELRTIVDVGANAGQFSAAVARENPSASIIAVEPLPDVAAAMRENFGDNPQIRVLEFAAGATPGSAPIHRHAHTHASSMLPTTRGFDEAFPDDSRGGGTRTVEVEVARLDDLIDAETLEGPVLLKLDVQGFEIEALKGAPVLLRRCDYVLAEAAMERVYDGEPLFAELYAYLRDQGFEFDRPVDFLRAAQGQVTQMDVLFRRRPRA